MTCEAAARGLVWCAVCLYVCTVRAAPADPRPPLANHQPSLPFLARGGGGDVKLDRGGWLALSPAAYTPRAHASFLLPLSHLLSLSPLSEFCGQKMRVQKKKLSFYI